MNEEIDKYLSRIYYDLGSPPSYAGVEKLWNYIKKDRARPDGVNKNLLTSWLDDQNTHNIFKTPKTNFPTEKIVVEYPDQQWEGDIMVIDHPKENKGFRYLICFIDLFTRYLWVRPLKTKSTSSATRALESIFEEERRCEVLRTDAGGEFLGKEFQDFLKENNIFHITAYGSVKACFVERVQRTIQDRLYKFFYEKQTYNFIDNIDAIVDAYNHTVHSSIGIAPAEINNKNYRQVYEKIYLPILNKNASTKVEHSFRIGDLVRISLSKDKFSRGYHQKYTEELFKIRNRIPSNPPRYKIEDLAGEHVKGSFYPQELLKFNTNDVDKITYKIEKIISTKKIKGKTYKLVKWLGYDKKFNSLIPASEVNDYVSK